MGLIKSLKRGIIYGGLMGGLIGSQFGSISGAYEQVLENSVNGNKSAIESIKSVKKSFPDEKTYQLTFKEINSAYEASKEKLENYESLSENKKLGAAAKDLKNYGLTFEELEPQIPTSADDLKRTGKSAMYGAGAGLILTLGMKIRGARKKKAKKNLEKKVTASIFGIATIAGILFGLNSMTGAAIGFSNAPSGFLGAVLFVGGIVGLYFSRK